MDVLKFVAVLMTVLGLAYGENLPPTCDSEIYCYGPLLHTVQMAQVYPDSKTFVDMKMKQPPNQTMQAFLEMMNRTLENPSVEEIKHFIEENFDPEGSEFEYWDPLDWTPKPRFLEKIMDPEYKVWAEKLHDLWKSLGRKMKDAVKDHQELYSIIYVPHPVIVPGGRFREFYYWDSYIVRGLLLSGMTSTVRGMLENFLLIVDRFGFIPNGGRVYYAKRSQPPLLIPMIDSYVAHTHDTAFIEHNIDTMEKEFQHWIVNHTVTITKEGKKYVLARYKDQSVGPRPESYREDYESAAVFRTDEEKENYFSELKTAAESGWDFSSRWFVLNSTNKGNITNMKVTSIIPVDLNAIIYWNAQILSEYFKMLGNIPKSTEYRNIAEQWLDAVTRLLWHDEVGAWLDYDMSNDMKRDYFYPSNIAPLWTGCYHAERKDQYIGRILKYLERSRIMINLGGIPTTLEHSGEQWDYPNAWPPLQYIMIEGLDATGDPWAQELAYMIAEKWVRSNYKAYNETEAMYEKYDATVLGGHGGGGEYETQLGFGWTNGVIMELLDKYGGNLTVKDRFEMEPLTGSISALAVANSATGSQILTALLALAATLAAGSIG
uniref:Trehalase n=1 Tax=Gampsocleis gratiosa TaxID=420844 RepID=A0A288VJ48_GAMGR|nr:membrane-bound trehalase-like protein isoform 1 [Gampsocleis gratiosa]AQY15497.1 membrane-bound trehalase-like protein isoform 2 [Gampsocleis gratiosa]AQY15498.1 membrane-bound trehalase-like protein isoform 3 [Gampsocleis gratiosa]